MTVTRKSSPRSWHWPCSTTACVQVIKVFTNNCCQRLCLLNGLVRDDWLLLLTSMLGQNKQTRIKLTKCFSRWSKSSKVENQYYYPTLVQIQIDDCLQYVQNMSCPILLTSAGPSLAAQVAASLGNTSTITAAAQHQSQGHIGNIGNMPNICVTQSLYVTSCKLRITYSRNSLLTLSLFDPHDRPVSSLWIFLSKYWLTSLLSVVSP